MCEHLPVILAPLFNVDDENLLQPEGELHEIVTLERPSHGSMRELGPQLAYVEPVLRVVYNVLHETMSVCQICQIAGTTVKASACRLTSPSGNMTL